MQRYSIEPRTKKCVKRYEFLSFARKYRKQLLNTELDGVKNGFKQVVKKAGDLLGNKIEEAVTTSNDDKIVKQEPVEEIIVPLEERDKILNTLRQLLS